MMQRFFRGGSAAKDNGASSPEPSLPSSLSPASTPHTPETPISSFGQIHQFGNLFTPTINESNTSSSPISTHLSVLVNSGSTLAALRWKCMSRTNGTNTTMATKETQEKIMIVPAMKAVGDIKQILEEFKKAKHGESSSLEEKSMTKVLEKVEGILRQLIRDNKENEEHFGEIADEIKVYLNDLILSRKQASSDLVAAASLELYDSHLNQVHQRDSEEIDFGNVYNGILTEKEQQCFSFCYSLFSVFVNPVMVNKRELIRWWMGMDLVDDVSQGKQLLSKLVSEGLLLSPIKNSRYTMPSMTLEQFLYTTTPKNRVLVACKSDMVVAIINMNAFTLNAKIFDSVFQMRDAKVVHLGSWHPCIDYVVLEDMVIKTLNSFQKLKEVRFLSFQHVSRLQELPTSVYNLEKLKVLDLRDCQDLRILPRGIESLKQLRYLDLSRCYELHQIPKGIAALSELVVLKGFVINDEVTNRSVVLPKHKTSSCPFRQLSKLKKLTKLSIRTKRMNFPRDEDAQTLCEMQELKKLKINWVCSGAKSANAEPITCFPTAIQKLELQASPATTSSRLLSLISNRSKSQLEKLYIKGGGLQKLDPQTYFFPNVKVVRFRHLAELHLDWHKFKLAFPNVSRFEIFKCPHLIFFPTDQNGVWEES